MSTEEKIEQIKNQLVYVFEKFTELNKKIEVKTDIVLTEERTHTDQIKMQLEAIEKRLEAIEKKID